MSGCINPFFLHREQALARFRITSHMKTSRINFPSLTNLATRPWSEPNGANSKYMCKSWLKLRATDQPRIPAIQLFLSLEYNLKWFTTSKMFIPSSSFCAVLTTIRCVGSMSVHVSGVFEGRIELTSIISPFPVRQTYSLTAGRSVIGGSTPVA
jgi:hypothetical protein